eukprot:4579734-Amphidinium_carterae.1
MSTFCAIGTPLRSIPRQQQRLRVMLSFAKTIPISNMVFANNRNPHLRIVTAIRMTITGVRKLSV